MDGYGEVRLPFRRSGGSRQIDARLSPLASLPEEAVQAATSFLAVRRLGGSSRQISRGRGLPLTVDETVPRDDRDGDEQAAYAVAACLQRADLNGSLGSFFNPPLTPDEREVARIEGWILGVV